MLGGVTLEDPATTFVDADVTIGADTVDRTGSDAGRHDVDRRGLPHSRGLPADERDVGDNVTILDHCVLVDSRVEAGARIGPFAHLRPASEVGEDAHVGNFVELKKTSLGRGSKANHLAYLGDATIGDGVNVGAGTITCNYDGVEQAPDGHRGRRVHRIRLAAGRAGADRRRARTSRRARRSPRTCRPTRLRVSRARQENKPGWARRAARQALERESPDTCAESSVTSDQSRCCRS